MHSYDASRSADWISAQLAGIAESSFYTEKQRNRDEQSYLLNDMSMQVGQPVFDPRTG